MNRETRTGLIIIKYGGESFFQNTLFYCLKYLDLNFRNDPKASSYHDLLNSKFQNSQIVLNWKREPKVLDGNELYKFNRNQFTDEFIKQDICKRFLDFGRFIYRNSKFHQNQVPDRILEEKSKSVCRYFINLKLKLNI